MPLLDKLQSFQYSVNYLVSRIFTRTHAVEIDRSGRASTFQERTYVTTTSATKPLHEPTSNFRRIAFTKPRSLMFGDLNLFGKPGSKWRKWVTLGIPLDGWAKFILTMNMFEAGIALVEGITNFIAQRSFNTHFWNVFNASLCGWGFLIGTTAMCGYLILWGPWRKSATAIHIFSFAYAFMLTLFLMASILWFYFAIHSEPIMLRNCMKLQITIANDTFPAPVWFKVICVDAMELWHSWQIAWGFVNLVQTYFGVVLVIWATDLKRRLMRERRWRLSKNLHIDGDWEHPDESDEKTTYYEHALVTPYIEDAKTVNLTKGGAVLLVGREVDTEEDWNMPALPKPSIGAAMMANDRIISATSFSSAMIPIQLDLDSVGPSTPHLATLDRSWQKFTYA